nr:hypothetical protein L203_05867 [Cryptococcus depauperatus CBS 7841]
MELALNTVQVVRWSALLFGVTYGIFHQSTLQDKYDKQKVNNQLAHRAHLIEEARKAYAAKKVAASTDSSCELDKAFGSI